ncbi:hypothetical protein COU78_01035 [Candidatus Peregrinibacteria bacterium CG10_big_fil_rev_8_21_14_0_10_49_24]|nr:MAG: hypothetical protein COV83_01285 [Candidatus Peregrinibacteria bacterium CG11_big_fil_rev_8_21_14_0_20_49_14]PIR51532.1 MAG: hypothetical protein COU78_01035 [Candidatus Peregrinibacteria bacterium CG10_big_fil_rev_8_21_14_0_10_49_24]PJA67825.1 MAG: hypothetical protein CO157_02305 [Candidatus Peregrinibacteria bacterium CG_4_9_14_3_um_filter_49_12]
MSRLKLVLSVLFAVALAQLLLLLAFTMLVYEVTPKSTLAQATFIGRMQPVLLGVRLADRSLNFLYRGSEPSEPLPLYQLQVKQEDLLKLEEETAKAEVFIADDAKFWIDATFTAEGEDYDVKIRIRGDRFNHWKFRKKSWRIKFPKEHLFHGMKEMTLIIPEDRAWFAEMLNSYRARAMGLLQPPMQFTTVSINGSAPLVYLETEHWTKEMLEKQGRPGDINFYKTGGVNTSSFDGWDPIFKDIAYWDKFTTSVVSAHDSFEELDLLFSVMQPGAHTQPDFRERIRTIFDLDVLTKWYAHSLLAGNLHVGGDNLRLLFDSSRGRFEPIPWDVFLVEPRSLFTLPGNPLWNEVFAVPEWRLAVHKFLWDYVTNEKQVEQDLAETTRLRSLVERAAYRDPLKLPSNRQVKNDLDTRSAQVRANLDFLHNELNTSVVSVTQRVPNSVMQAKGVSVVLDIVVSGPMPAVLSGVSIPLSVTVSSDIELYRDTGDGVFGASDTALSHTLERGKLSDTLHVSSYSEPLFPEQPPTDASGEPLEIPRTLYRFFLVGLPVIAQSELPISLDIRNVVSGSSATILRTTVVNDRANEERIPSLP